MIERSRLYLRRAVQLSLVILVPLALVVWLAGRPMLVAVGAFLIEEDPLAAGETVAVSGSMQDAAREAALLYQQNNHWRIIVTDWIPNPMLEQIRLGIHYVGTAAMGKVVLERGSVPSSAITILPGPVDSTESEMAAIAAFADQHHLPDLLVITARSRTARTKWLLQHKLDRTRVSVRSSRFDRFSVDGWWRDSDQRREVLAEYLRWLNTAVLRDRSPRSSATRETLASARD